MSIALHRFARFAFRHPKRVLGGWLVLLGVVAALLATQPRSIASGFSLHGTPSQEVLDTVSARLPEAGGTQGTLVFTARDGGRIDTPARAAAIAEAADRAASTPYVVNREAKLSEQRGQVREQIAARVEQSVAAKLGPELTTLATTLDAAATRPGAQSLGGLATRARSLATASPHERIVGTTSLLADLKTLTAAMGAKGISPQALGLPAGSAAMTDPTTAVTDGVAKASAQVYADLDRLTAGTTPQGHALTVGDRTLASVRVSDDGRVAMLPLQFTASLAHLPESALPDVLTATERAVEGTGLTAYPSTALNPTKPPLGGHELIGVAIAVVVLLLTLGSLVAAGLPVLTALVGVFIGVGGAFALSSHYVMTTATPALGLMIGLAVGIDYALFILHKHRKLIVTQSLTPGDAVGRAVGTAGSAVLFAGLTVITALLSLLILRIDFVSTMALTAATTVALAVAISLTALPALLGLVGSRVVGRRAQARHADRPAHRHHPVARRWIRAVTALPVLTALLVTLGLGAVASGVTGMRLGMPDGGVAAAGSPQRVNYDATTRAFGTGANAPLVVTVAHSDGSAMDTAELLSRQDQLAGVEGATSARLMGATSDRTLAIFQVIPVDGPTDPATEALVHRLRGTELSGVAPLGVSGLTAINIDLSDVLRSAIPVYVGVVVALSIVILLLVFRSLVVPLVATGGFLLTISATLGLVARAFGDERFTWLVGVDRSGPILSFLPIMATGILYGLAMDYQVFLGTSMREDHVHGASAREAVRTGFHHASLVVVAAAAIMVAVFGGFVLGADTTIRQFGFALSVGILIDAFLVRMILMPALLHFAGEKAWWLPAWLDRLLPRVDIEGDRLRQHLDRVP
ncbi:MAG: MMPL family transporter [Austwickia sp.]|jgi:RND superfamily putative drug exporter|nr:MAG: MMPL family transporter [Austwickia sp.]